MPLGINSRLVTLGLLLGFVAAWIPHYFLWFSPADDHDAPSHHTISTWASWQRYQDAIPIIGNHDPKNVWKEGPPVDSPTVDVPPTRIAEKESEFELGKVLDGRGLSLPSLPKWNGDVMPVMFTSHGKSNSFPSTDAVLVSAWKLMGNMIAEAAPRTIIAVSSTWQAERDGQVLVNLPQEDAMIMPLSEGRAGGTFSNNISASNITSRLIHSIQSKGFRVGSVNKELDPSIWIPLRSMLEGHDEFSVPPVIQVSLPGGYNPESAVSLGTALEPLRAEGFLILTLGMPISEQVQPNLDKYAAETFLGSLTRLLTLYTSHPRRQHSLSPSFLSLPSFPLFPSPVSSYKPPLPPSSTGQKSTTDMENGISYNARLRNVEPALVAIGAAGSDEGEMLNGRVTIKDGIIQAWGHYVFFAEQGKDWL